MLKKTINKSSFNKHFDIAIQNVLEDNDIDLIKLKYKLTVIEELDVYSSSKDDWMRHVLKSNNINSELFYYEDAIRLLSAGNKHYPLWAKVKRIDDDKIEIIFSSRFRQLKTCHNQESGIPPFENINTTI